MSGRQTVALLAGGLSSEDYLSRRSARFIHGMLMESPYDVKILDWHKEGGITLLPEPNEEPEQSWPNLLECFARYRPNVVFNCLHGEKENAGQLQGFLELAGIPLTGNALAPSVVGMDKMLSKDFFRRLAITTPQDYFLGHLHTMNLDTAMMDIDSHDMDFPMMLKASHGGSSEGVALVCDEEECRLILEEWQHNPTTRFCPIFLEEYIKGSEYCVGIFGHWDQNKLTVLPMAKIDFPGDVFDKDLKYANTYEVKIAPELDSRLETEMRRAAGNVHRILRFSGFSRMDFIVQNGIPYALEVNTHPGMSSMSIIIKMLAASDDLDAQSALIRMIKWAMADYPQHKAY